MCSLFMDRVALLHHLFIFWKLIPQAGNKHFQPLFRVLPHLAILVTCFKLTLLCKCK